MTFREGLLLMLLVVVMVTGGLGFVLYQHNQRLNNQDEILQLLTERMRGSSFQGLKHRDPEAPPMPPQE